MSDRLCAIDLFCGAGGLTRGFENVGIDVTMGMDADPRCAFPYERNNNARYLQERIEQTTGKIIDRALGSTSVRILAGCAPCQPFSTYTQGRRRRSDDSRWFLLREFSRLVREVGPEVVTMENVPRLRNQDVFKDFVIDLEQQGYHVSCAILICAEYGVPQRRKRLVMLGSRLAPISLVARQNDKSSSPTVRETIAELPEIEAGQTCALDSLHQAPALSEINLARIRSSTPGGTWRDWNRSLVSTCHTKSSGRKYSSIYGRMAWDEPAPTLTTQFYNLGSGRYGHPEQDRAITFREGALIQGFPRCYEFFELGKGISRKILGRLIGNAVPVQLAEAIGRSILCHLDNSA